MFATDDFTDNPDDQPPDRVDPDLWADTDLWAEAACRRDDGALGSLFFSDQIPDILQARSICQSCSLQEPCLEGALERHEPWGVWGGQLFANGRVLAQKRKRGRPPKHPRPDEVWMSA